MQMPEKTDLANWNKRMDSRACLWQVRKTGLEQK